MSIPANRKFTRLILSTHSQWVESLTLYYRLQTYPDALLAIETEEVQAVINLSAEYIPELTSEALISKIKLDVQAKASANVGKLVETALRTGLVFCHSVFDAALNDLLLFHYELAPGDFRERIGERKISFNELDGKDQKQLESKLVAEFLEQKAKESVTKRVQLLFSLCKPTSESLKNSSFPTILYCESKLNSVDLKRHKVVHALDRNTVEFADVNYLKFVFLVCFRAFGKHHNLQLDENEGFEFFAGRT
jgi:hypothetical protein